MNAIETLRNRTYRAHSLLSRLCARRHNVPPLVLARASDLHTRLHAALRLAEPLDDFDDVPTNGA